MFSVFKSGQGSRKTNKQIIRPIVPTAKEKKEAVIGLDIRWANSVLIPT
jgi:hypothetical protein